MTVLARQDSVVALAATEPPMVSTMRRLLDRRPGWSADASFWTYDPARRAYSVVTPISDPAECGWYVHTVCIACSTDTFEIVGGGVGDPHRHAYLTRAVAEAAADQHNDLTSPDRCRYLTTGAPW